MSEESTLAPPAPGTLADDSPSTTGQRVDSASENLQELLDRAAATIAEQRLPVSTYRLQFNAGFTFAQAQQLAGYFAALGISDLYASPFLQARAGSIHGYDVVDHSLLNREIGTWEDLEALSQSLRERRMGMILDVVPNHMCVASRDNAWWLDVLENGLSSQYASYFDIDWRPPKPDLVNKVLLPVLGDQYGKVLEDGQISIQFEEGAFWVRYCEGQWPIAPTTYALILSLRLEELQKLRPPNDPDLLEYLSILTAVKNLPPETESQGERLAERRREKEIVKRRLKNLLARSAEIAAFVEGNLRLLAGERGNPASFDKLDELLSAQPYRLCFWRVASDEINYRRFFDINELAAICVENREVFEDTHRLVFDLVDRGIVQGFRIDHPDGLYDPCGYLRQLQEWRLMQICRREWESLRREQLGNTGEQEDRETIDGQWQNVQAQLRDELHRQNSSSLAPLVRPLYLVVEKILGGKEEVPEDWPVHGTVGYKFLGRLNGLFVDRSAEKQMSATYARFTGEPSDFRELAYRCKRLIARASMASELSMLGFRLDRISERNRWTRDFTLSSLTRAAQEVMACFSVYRTYVVENQVLDRDQRYVEAAVARAKRRNPAISSSVFDFIRDLLLARFRENADEEERRSQWRLIGRFQQLTSPIMAKAVEDTAYYRFNRLVSLNEVGGEPERFGTDVAEFHELLVSRQPRMSRSLLATSTHDTKRGEDVRARINVLSEIPRQWRQSVSRWARWNRRFRSDVESTPAPSSNDEYLLYQTLVGIWPDAIPTGQERQRLVERVQQYVLKVAREAKQHTSWISPHEAYERAVIQFVADLFREDKRRSFLPDLDDFARSLADHGRWNSLAQVVLKMASPGVADIYQGNELWSLTLVDPDNRQRVDYALRQRLLDQFDQATSREALIEDILRERQDGRIKLYVTMRSLRLRLAHPELFTEGEYVPLETGGAFAESVVALARRSGTQLALAIVPRLTVKVCGFGGGPPLGGCWRDTAVLLPAGERPEAVTDAFTGRSMILDGERLLVSQLLSHFPVALLEGKGER